MARVRFDGLQTVPPDEVIGPAVAEVTRTRRTNGRLTDAVLAAKFSAMIELLYAHATDGKTDGELTAAVTEYRAYLRGISLQDVADDDA